MKQKHAGCITYALPEPDACRVDAQTPPEPRPQEIETWTTDASMPW